MSFSFSAANESVEEATRLAKEDGQLPETIRNYVLDGIRGIAEYHDYDEALKLNISAYGHLCSGKGSYEVTTATVTIQKSQL